MQDFKVGAPQVSAFDPLTGIALPMLQGTETLRAFSQKPGDMVSLLNAMPAPKPLTAQSANTPELQSILQAADAAKTVQAAKQNQDYSGLLDQALIAIDETEPATASSPPDWLAQGKGALAGVSGYLRIMRELGVQHEVPFKPIEDNDPKLALPAELKPIAAKLQAFALGGSPNAGLTPGEEALLRHRYIHQSAHWNAAKGRNNSDLEVVFINRPSDNNKRVVHPNE